MKYRIPSSPDPGPQLPDFPCQHPRIYGIFLMIQRRFSVIHPAQAATDDLVKRPRSQQNRPPEASRAACVRRGQHPTGLRRGDVGLTLCRRRRWTSSQRSRADWQSALRQGNVTGGHAPPRVTAGRRSRQTCHPQNPLPAKPIYCVLSITQEISLVIRPAQGVGHRTGTVSH